MTGGKQEAFSYLLPILQGKQILCFHHSSLSYMDTCILSYGYIKRILKILLLRMLLTIHGFIS